MDIHIGKIEKHPTLPKTGEAQIIYHIPIETPKTGIIPTPVSVLTNLEQAEIDALANGTLVEFPTSTSVNELQTQAEIVAAIKLNYQNVKAEYNKRYNFEYKYYGVKFNAST